jgi:hypothetical protein
VHELRTNPITDVFIFSHGWQGDIPAARDQYNRWLAAMHGCAADRQAMRDSRLNFQPLLIGFHWPSLPFGDEAMSRMTAAASDQEHATEDLVKRYSERIARTPRAQQSLHRIVAASQGQPPDSLSRQLLYDFQVLQLDAGLVGQGLAAAPGADAERFDPTAIYRELNSEGLRRGAFSGGPGSTSNPLMDLLRTLSFWKMKDRARKVGESGGHLLLASLQAAVPPERHVRFHLMGHSFGCIVVSAMLRGPQGRAYRIAPVSSVSFVQGALSLWSFSGRAYNMPQPGYFRQIIDRRLVTGPIITTQSTFDIAVGRWYPLAAGVARQVAMANRDDPGFPKYGGIGSYGIQGGDCRPRDFDILPIERTYGFEPGRIYNIESSTVIKDGDTQSGAHSDIAHPEVAHAIWEAARVETEKPVPAPPHPIPRPPPPPPPTPVGPVRRFLRRD